MSFNELNDAQIEVLNLLQEEAAEVIQDVAKILRHGLYSTDPTNPNSLPNIHHLAKELGDMEGAKALCVKYILHLDEVRILAAKRNKLESIDQWLHHASAAGLFTPLPQPRPRAPGEPSDDDRALERLARHLKDDRR